MGKCYPFWTSWRSNWGIEVAKKNKIKKIIGFDMGGTSADIWHYDGEVEKDTN